jgi:hypothetical protein
VATTLAALAVFVSGAALGARPPAAPCPATAGLEPLLESGTVLLLGEMHGTVESPAFTGAVVCSALERGLEVVVGLEIPYQEQSLFDAYLASDGGELAERILLASEFWTRSYQDGRSSEAMLGLVRDLRDRLAERAPLRLVLLDEQVPERDAAMAARLSAAAERAPRAFVVALTGNLHARLERGSPWNESFEPMGMFVRRRLPGRSMLSLDVSHSGGSAWFCTTADAADCGERALAGDGDAAAQGVHLTPGASPHYSGRYSVGALHASPPAARAATPRATARTGPPP